MVSGLMWEGWLGAFATPALFQMLTILTLRCFHLYVTVYMYKKKEDENSNRANKDVLQIQLNPRPRL